MKKIEIFDPSMCCSTGVCGPSIDPEILRIATVLNILKGKGVDVERHNLSHEPQDFVANVTVRALLDDEGNDVLPITMLDGEVVKKAGYPTNAEFAVWLGLSDSDLYTNEAPAKISAQGCDCKTGSGCC